MQHSFQKISQRQQRCPLLVAGLTNKMIINMDGSNQFLLSQQIFFESQHRTTSINREMGQKWQELKIMELKRK